MINMKDLQKIITEEISKFNSRNLFNVYYEDDFEEFIEELEDKYNIEIDRISCKIKEV